jgi:hypothetical protein
MRLGRPRVCPDPSRIAALRAQGRSWREITLETGVTREQHNPPRVARPETYEIESVAKLLFNWVNLNNIRRSGIVSGLSPHEWGV